MIKLLRVPFIIFVGLFFLYGPLVSEAALYANSLKLHSKGVEVSSLQTFLKNKGYYTYPEITGYFGPATQSAVISFQRAYGIDPTGNVGEITQAKIEELMYSQSPAPNSTKSGFFMRDLSLGDSGKDVQFLQTLLNLQPDTQIATSGPGSRGNETLYFGQQTKYGVEKFQKKYAEKLLPFGVIIPTGVASISTRLLLLQVTLDYLKGNKTSACTFNGTTVNNGDSIKAYRDSIVSSNRHCESEMRVCQNGNLTGSYSSPTCQVRDTSGGGGGGDNKEPVIHLEITSSAINKTETTKVIWDVKNATNCVAGGDWSGDKNARKGSQTIGPFSTPGFKTFTLMCSGDGGEAVKEVSLNVFNGTKYWTNQPLSTLDGQTQYFDASWPVSVNLNEKFPLVIWLHGSGWWAPVPKSSFKRAEMEMLASKGYVVVSMDYRISNLASPTHKNHFPAAIQDVRCAIKRFRSDLYPKLPVDKSNIVISGASAGGNMALMIAALSGKSASEIENYGIAYDKSRM